jgi:hypothetical protein
MWSKEEAHAIHISHIGTLTRCSPAQAAGEGKDAGDPAPTRVLCIITKRRLCVLHAEEEAWFAARKIQGSKEAGS